MNQRSIVLTTVCLALSANLFAATTPSVTQAFVAPEGLVLRGTGGSPMGTYEVLSATDFTLSVSNWPALATYQFDPAGNFDCTNPISPADGQRFYAIHVVPPSTNAPTLQIIQAEDGTFTGSVANNHSGYTGTGFVDTDNAVGSYIEIEFGRQHAGTETMYVRYAHGKTDTRSASLMVNGATNTSSLAFPPTGDFTNWQYVTNTIPVVVGRNVLRITALNSGGLVNVDRFEVTGDPQYKLKVGVNGNGTVSLNPSNAYSYYNPSTLVTLTATALTGSVFTAWSGDLVSSNNPDTLLVTSNKSVTANFEAYLHFPIYVSPTGSDSNPGTIDQPFYSLAKAVSNAVAGDTITMRGGTFTYAATITIEKPGTSNNPISIVAYPGEHPVLDYSTWHPASEDERGNARGFHITTNAQYWVLQGLEIQYAPDNGIKCEGGHISFDRMVFHDNGDTGLQIGLNKDTLSSNPDPEHFAAYNYVLNCDSYHNNDPATDYENADGFACKLYAGVGNHFYGCRAWNNADDGYDLFAANDVVVIDNCWAFLNGKTVGGAKNPQGDGNGFKLGGKPDGSADEGGAVHKVTGSSAFENLACGFVRNNNPDVPMLSNCGVHSNGSDDYCQVSCSPSTTISTTGAAAKAMARNADGSLPALN